jgi:hypothetical protein
MRSESDVPEPFARLRTEVVTKDDGRYLIYYSWPEEPGDADGHGTHESDPPGINRGPHPPTEPWTPHGGPVDV